MKDIRESLTKASEIYSDQVIIRAGINAIPFVGGSIDVILSSLGQKFVIKRIEDFITELKSEVELLESQKINHDFLNSEEGFDLIVKSFNSASKTRQREKLRIYAKILKNALTSGKAYEEDEPEIFLKIVEELSIKEFKVATLLFKLKANLKPHESGRITDVVLLANENSDFDKDELVYILVRLEKIGLIREHMITVLGAGGGSYKVNKLFVKFMDFIEVSKE
jgi:hypothetical protein